MEVVRSDMLYNLALQCAELNDNGCSVDCTQCQFNVFNYVFDIREASLLKANAYTDYHNRKRVYDRAQASVNAEKLVGPITLIILIVGMMWCCSSVKSCMTPREPTQNIPITSMGSTEQGRNSQLVIDDEVRYLLNNPNRIENVERVLRVMQIQRVRDVNRDGLINCIDYSLTFRRLYGSNAKLIINRNPNNGMHHMFIKIWYNGSETMRVEPQGTPDWYSMGAVWGTRYDSFYDRDVTSSWGHVTPGMY